MKRICFIQIYKPICDHETEVPLASHCPYLVPDFSAQNSSKEFRSDLLFSTHFRTIPNYCPVPPLISLVSRNRLLFA